jgi:hypothetical protein
MYPLYNLSLEIFNTNISMISICVHLQDCHVIVTVGDSLIESNTLRSVTSVSLSFPEPSNRWERTMFKMYLHTCVCSSVRGTSEWHLLLKDKTEVLFPEDQECVLQSF